MPITLNGTTGITTPGLINTGSTTFVDLTTTGNTILGDASTDTLNVANGNLVLNSSGNLGVGTSSPVYKLDVNGVGRVQTRLTVGSVVESADRMFYVSGTASTSGANQFGMVLNPTYPTTPTSTIFNLYTGPNLTAGTTVTTVYGHYLEAINAAGSTVTNRWGIYQAGGSDNNYFAGKLGIGTTSPSQTLDVNGNITATAWIGRANGSAPSADCAIYRAADNTLGFSTGSTERARITSGGDFISGGTSALQSAKITAYGSVSAQNGGVDGTFANAFVGVYSGNSNEHNAIQTAVSSSGVGSGFRFKTSDGGGLSTTKTTLDVTRDRTVFYNDGTEKMRLDSGNLLVARTNATFYGGGAKLGVEQTSGSAWAIGINANGNAVVFNHTGNTSSAVGSISVTTSATAYNTSSDYRLKNTIAPMTGALAKVALLKPCTYKWNADGSSGQGFIAHELAEVCPDAVTGEKDAVDEDGNIKPQGIDTSYLVATLTAAIQELKSELDSVKTELAALKGN